LPGSDVSPLFFFRLLAACAVGLRLSLLEGLTSSNSWSCSFVSKLSYLYAIMLFCKRKLNVSKLHTRVLLCILGLGVGRWGLCRVVFVAVLCLSGSFCSWFARYLDIFTLWLVSRVCCSVWVLCGQIDELLFPTCLWSLPSVEVFLY
jgi:hypothetical protein